VTGQDVEVGIGVEHGDAVSNSDPGDQAVDEPPDGLATAPAATVETCRHLEVDALGAQRRSPSEEPTELVEMVVVASSGQDLHANGVADGDVSIQKFVDPLADRTSGVAQELHPGRRIDHDHPP